MSTTPYGAWQSEITVDLMTAQTVRLVEPSVDGATLYWLQHSPADAGRTSLWRREPGAEPEQITPPEADVRSAVHEYGGGAYAADRGVVVFTDHRNRHRLHRRDPDGGTSPLTPAPTGDRPRFRYADLRLHTDLDLLLAVREEHHPDLAEPRNTLVALSLSGSGPADGTVLREGADFVSTPELDHDPQTGRARLAWVEWDHPHMPWESSRVLVADLDLQTLALGTPVAVAGGPGESAVQPRWLSPGRLVFATDRSNWWNLHLWSVDAPDTSTDLCARESEFCDPQWVLGQQPYAVLDPDRLLCRWTDDGMAQLGVLQVSTGQVTPVPTQSATVDAIAAGPAGDALVLLGFTDRWPGLFLLDPVTGELSQVRAAAEHPVPTEMISTPRELHWEGEQGTVFGWFYPPTNPNHRAPEGTLPPLITRSHGGPTSEADAALQMSVQYWTSRGFAVLDVNYGGSSGRGREYRDRLRGNWGVTDVADCAAGAQAMADRGLVDPDQLAISGSSAGGYTTLQALTTTDVFDVGVSKYGIGDLMALATETHKFESRYLDGLVGPLPEKKRLYEERSPINHVDQLSCPMLIMQGSEDRVVPPGQAETMSAAIRSKELPLSYLLFEGEGHGFREAETIVTATEAQLSFYGQVFGFTPADELDPLDIENLSPATVG